MFDVLSDFASRPEPFSKYTAPELWNHPYVSKQMLKAHLDTGSDLASRRLSYIQDSVSWIDQTLHLHGKKLCDLGCGPGLYTTEFHDKGASVLGIDVSTNSLAHAKGEATLSGRSIEYVEGDYTKATLPAAVDVFTLIFNDYCVLSAAQRSSLLSKIGESLVQGGHLVFDAHGIADFEKFTERDVIESQLMNGFWSPSEYVGFMKSFKYNEEKVSLERYLIVEPGGWREIFNWLRYFSRDSIERELKRAGFTIVVLAGSLKGDAVTRVGSSFGVIARKI